MTRLAYVTLGLMCLFAILVAYIASPLATPMIRWAANTFVEELTIEDVSGSLYAGLSLDNVSFNTSGLNLKVKQIATQINWQCTQLRHICIDQLQIVSPAVVLLPSTNTEADESATSNTPLELPISLSIQQIDITNVQVKQAPYTVSLAQFTTQLALTNKVTLTDTQLDKLTIHSDAEPAPSKPFSGLRYQAPSLPHVALPIDIEMNTLQATEIRYTRAAGPQTLNAVAFNSLEMTGSQLSWKDLLLSHPEGKIVSSGNATLSEQYPIAITLQGDAQLENKTQAIALYAVGALSALDFEAKLEGLINASASLKMNVLDDSLPIDGDIIWPAQQVAYQDIESLKAGSLQVHGRMGDYQLLVDSAAVLQSIGETAFNADLSLSSSSLNVNQLDATLLNGKVNTSGSVNFVDGYSGQGVTTIEGIDAATIVAKLQKDTPYLSSASIPKANWRYIIQQSDKGVNLLVTDIDAELELNQKRANIQGQAVYSQGERLGVATLSVAQQNAPNKINLVAQILDQRLLNVNTDIALPDIQEILADVQGSILGNVKIEGEWTNPSFSFRVDVDDVIVPESLSAPLYQQGVIASHIKGEGKLAEHQVYLDANSQDYGFELNLDGGFSSGRYGGAVTQSMIRVLTSHWQLATPFELELLQTPQSITVSAHCWQQQNSSSELCVDAASYTQEQATWSLTGSNLPIGEWAKMATPLITAVSDSAQLSLTSQGSFHPQNGVIADATLSLKPSTWTFTQNNPVAIDIDTLDASVSLAQARIRGHADFISEDLGKLGFDIDITGEELLSGKIDGKLLAENVRLSPLAELSPSVFELGGVINGQILFDGELAKPSLQGSLTINDGAIDIEQSPLTLSQWQQTVYFSGRQANLEGSFILGDGNGSMLGMLSWQDAPFAELTLAADSISIEHEDIRLAFSPDLEAKITAESTRLTGDINIPYGRIKLDTLPDNAVTPSRDVYLRGEPKSTDPLENIFADITLHIDEEETQEVKVDAFGLTANLHGELQIQNQPSVVGYGDLQVLDGRYQAYGQNLMIRTGEVQFNGPIGQPFLFVEAIRDPELTDDGVIAGVRIDGAASKPNVSLFSEPSMEQGQNLLYLLNGSGNLNSGSSGSESYQAALVGFGLSRSGKVTGAIGDALGIDDLSVTTVGQGENTRVSMTGNIAKNLSVRFGVGLFDNSQEVAIRYRLLPQLYIEAVQRLSDAVSLIDLYYEFSLGDPQQPTEPQGD